MCLQETDQAHVFKITGFLYKSQFIHIYLVTYISLPLSIVAAVRNAENARSLIIKNRDYCVSDKCVVGRVHTEHARKKIALSD